MGAANTGRFMSSFMGWAAQPAHFTDFPMKTMEIWIILKHAFEIPFHTFLGNIYDFAREGGFQKPASS